jgi:hypothetical protein
MRLCVSKYVFFTKRLSYSLVFLLLLNFSSLVYSQDKSKDFENWRQRFSQDMSRAAKNVCDGKANDAIFSSSVQSKNLALGYLEDLLKEGKLFNGCRPGRVWDAGTSIAATLSNATYLAYGGEYAGAKISKYLIDEPYEVIYFVPPFDKNYRTGELIYQAFNTTKFEAPPIGVLIRNKVPLLFFKRIDGKLYLAAFSNEFMTVLDAIFNAQIG